MNETIKTIFERRSIRSYTDKPLTEEQTELLVRVAAASPTARNEQNWHFTFVTDKKVISAVENDAIEGICSKDAAAAERIKSRGNTIFYGAPLVVFVSSDHKKRWCDVDAGIAAENLALAARSMGLGSVIIAMAEAAFAGENGEKNARLLEFPEGFTFGIAIAIGEPAADKPAHPDGENKFSFIR